MKKTVKILGAGCQKCKATIEIVEDVVNSNKLDVEVIKIEDILEIMKYNVLSTPAVVINEEIKIKGRVPSKLEIAELLK
jgi:small redox-active disulfide protein 2